MRRFSHILGPLLGVSLLLIAIVVLYQKLRILSLADIRMSLERIPPSHIIAALVLTGAYYVLITAYDTLSFRVIGHPLPYRRIALAAFTGYALSHNIGLTAISSGSVRYRVHSSFGLTAAESAKVILFSSLSFWVGFLAVSAFTFLALPIRNHFFSFLPPDTLRIFGCVSLGLLLIYGWYATVSRHGKTIGPYTLPKLTPSIFFMQVLIGSLDWILAAGIAFILLPRAELGLFAQFFGMFVLAQVSGLLSQVPGGFGIFEGIMILLLPKHSTRTMIIGVLLIYRIIFYIAPLILATTLLLTHEVRLVGKKTPSDR